MHRPCRDCTSSLVSCSGNQLEKVTDFVYLGAWIATTERDLRVRKAKAWAACHKLKKMWKSDLRRGLKIRLFVATVESILLSSIWQPTESNHEDPRAQDATSRPYSPAPRTNILPITCLHKYI